MQYFYIICRDNSIHEVRYTKDMYMKSLDQWSKGGILLIPSRNSEAPIGINCADVKNIFSDVDYENWHTTTKVKQYVKNGTWFDGRDGSIIRVEAWKQKELGQVKAIEAKKTETDKGKYISEEKWLELRMKIRDIFSSYSWQENKTDLKK